VTVSPIVLSSPHNIPRRGTMQIRGTSEARRDTETRGMSMKGWWGARPASHCEPIPPIRCRWAPAGNSTSSYDLLVSVVETDAVPGIGESAPRAPRCGPAQGLGAADAGRPAKNTRPTSRPPGPRRPVHQDRAERPCAHGDASATTTRPSSSERRSAPPRSGRAAWDSCSAQVRVPLRNHSPYAFDVDLPCVPTLPGRPSSCPTSSATAR
jgi:hypothetical protein